MGQARQAGLRERVDQLEDERAWMPNVGDTLVGEVVDIDSRTTNYGTSPVVVVKEDETGEVVAFWAFHTVARSQLAKARPQIGERIAIKRLSDSDTASKYKRYRVVMDRASTRTFDWSTVDTAGGDVPSNEMGEPGAGLPFDADDDEDLF